MSSFMAGSNAGSVARQQQQQQQQAVTQATEQIDKAFSGYNAPWYQNYTNAYTTAQMPNMMQQYYDTQKQLGYQLGNQGLTKSSSAGMLGSRLNQNLGQNQQQVATDALNATNQLRSNVENERATLVGQANTANDPMSIAQNATGAAAQFVSPSIAAPVGGLFQNFANMYLGRQYRNMYNNPSYAYPYTNSFSGGGYGSSIPAVAQG